MRHCFGENIDVYEAKAKTPAKLFKKIGKHLEKFEYCHVSVNNYYDEDLECFVALVYAHN